MQKYLSQYLEKYAEPEICLTKQVNKTYKHIINIPCFNEPDFDLLQYDQESFSECLLVLIINETKSAGIEGKNNNQKLLCEINRLKPILKFIDLFIINKTQSSHLPEKQGVGLARKIAADFSLKLYSENKIIYPWLYCLDADVIIPINYLTAIEQYNSQKNIAGFVFNFEHVSKSIDLLNAVKKYESKLNSYVNGLKLAGSEYAFHTIGSTMVINLDCYAKARGFPKRLAGEDFYMLNKLAKLGKIISLEQPKLKLSARTSDRVAFGTGLAIDSILSGQPCEPYPDVVFDLLKTWLTGLGSIANNNFIGWEQYSDELSLYSDLINLDSVINKLNQQNLGLDRRKQYLTHWFDGFKTMKFINYFSI